MIHLLIIDECTEKKKYIINLIRNSSIDTTLLEINTASSVEEAKSIFQHKVIDVLVLDHYLPNHLGDDATLNTGILLLQTLKISPKYTYPSYVMCLSSHEITAGEVHDFDTLIHTKIQYDPCSTSWELLLIECMKAAIAMKTSIRVNRTYNYDIAVICALTEELELVKRGITDIVECHFKNDKHIYYQGYFMKGSKKIRVVCTQSTHMGMVSAAMLTTKLIYTFTPKYLVMTGIAAGIKGKVNIGDAVVAEYVWDHGAGKDAVDGTDEVHHNTIEQIAIDTDMTNHAQRLQADTEVLSSIKEQFAGHKPDHPLQIHIGAVATGSAVIASSDKVKEIQDQIRNVLAIEMEIFGVYYAARWAIHPKPRYLAIKSVSDFADEHKNDDYHAYASYTSAKVMAQLAKNYFEY